MTEPDRSGNGNVATRRDIAWVNRALGILVALNLAILAITFSVLRLPVMIPGGAGPV